MDPRIRAVLPSPPEALVQAIAQQRDDDGPRLALADWYKEQGHEAHGTFITLQLRAARAPPSSRAYADLALQAHRLKERDGAAWSLALPDVADLHFSFSRGVPEHLEGPLASLGADADRLALAAPLVRSLFCATAAEALPMKRLLASSFWNQVRRLELECLRSAPLEALLGSDRLGALAELQVRGRDLEHRAWEALGAQAGLGALHTLNLSRTNAGPWLRGLRHAAPPPAVRTLLLGAVTFDVDDLAGLLDSRLWTRLERLDLGGCRLSEEKASLLARAPPGLLASLDLSGTQLGPGGARAFLAGAHLDLRWTSLNSAGLTDACVDALLSAQCLLQVQWLDLRHNAFSGPSMQALRARFGEALVLG